MSLVLGETVVELAVKVSKNKIDHKEEQQQQQHRTRRYATEHLTGAVVIRDVPCHLPELGRTSRAPAVVTVCQTNASSSRLAGISP